MYESTNFLEKGLSVYVEFQKIYKFIWNLFSKDIPFPHYLCQTKALIYKTRNDIIICVYEGW